jgi:hypothetical protein
MCTFTLLVLSNIKGIFLNSRNSRMRGFLPSLLIASMLSLPTSVRGEMIVRDYRPARHDRFYSGSDKAFVGASYDFSGVGVGNRGHWATLVSDNCFLSAYHRRPVLGEQVKFWSSNVQAGPSFSYTVTGGTRVGRTDIWVGWFEKPVDTSILRYPVLVLRAVKSYISLSLLNYGMNHKVGRNVLDRLVWFTYGGSTGLSVLYDYDNNDDPSVGGDETWLMGGDSGAPSFAVFNGSSRNKRARNPCNLLRYYFLRDFDIFFLVTTST